MLRGIGLFLAILAAAAGLVGLAGRDARQVSARLAQEGAAQREAAAFVGPGAAGALAALFHRGVLMATTMALALFALAACSSGNATLSSESLAQPQQISPEEPVESISVPARWATAVATDLATLTASSDAIFVGRIIRLKDQREEPLVPGLDAPAAPVDGKPSRQPGTFPISIFEVQVEQAVSGDYPASSVVLIEQPGGISERADGSRVRVDLEGDQPLRPGQRYLFFAREKDSGALSVAPFARLLFTEHGLEPVASWSNLGAMRALSGRAPDEAISLVKGSAGR